MWLPSEIRADFARVMGDASIVLLHSAPRAMGAVAGGIDGVMAALFDALGARRTLVVPTFTTDRLDPSALLDPADAQKSAPRKRWDAIRAELPLFDARTSTPRTMGRIADLVWRREGALRTSHPVESIAAIGPRAEWITKPHPIDDPKGPRSPWARLVEADARVVLLGVGFERCTLLHHCERMIDFEGQTPYAFPVEVDGARAWIEVEASGGSCSDGFSAIEPHVVPTKDSIGHAAVIVLSARALFDAGCALLRRDPRALLCAAPDCSQCARLRGAVLDEPSTRR